MKGHTFQVSHWVEVIESKEMLMQVLAATASAFAGMLRAVKANGVMTMERSLLCGILILVQVPVYVFQFFYNKHALFVCLFV